MHGGALEGVASVAAPRVVEVALFLAVLMLMLQQMLQKEGVPRRWLACGRN